MFQFQLGEYGLLMTSNKDEAALQGFRSLLPLSLALISDDKLFRNRYNCFILPKVIHPSLNAFVPGFSVRVFCHISKTARIDQMNSL